VSPVTKLEGSSQRIRDESQEFAEIADGQVAAHLLRFRADHIHAREGAVTQPGGLPVLPRTDRVSMNTERPANALCEAKTRSSRSKFGGLPSAVAARSVPAGLRAHILGWDGGEEKRHIEPTNDRSVGSPKQKRSSHPPDTPCGSPHGVHKQHVVSAAAPQ